MTLRRIRAVLVSLLLWGVVWAPIGAVIGLVHYLTPPSWALVDVPPSFARLVTAVLRFGATWGLLGAISGALFALVLAFAERNHSVANLSLARVTIWGVLGAVILPGTVLVLFLILFPLQELSVKLVPLLSIGLLGASCAAGTLVLARRTRAPHTDVRDVAA